MIITSCASRKRVVYFQDVKKEQKIIVKNYKEPTLKVDDRITINVSSIDPETAAPFNLPVVAFNTSGISVGGQPQMQSYLINKYGKINFPQLGEIEVVGLTRTELEKKIQNKIIKYIPDVKVIVQLVNFRITILGEVQKPGEYIISRDKVNILQAIGLAGDLTIHGKRETVKLIRESKGIIKTHILDLTSTDVLDSKNYNLQQNDIIYVAPNKPRINAAAASPTASYLISATGLLITIITFILRDQ